MSKNLLVVGASGSIGRHAVAVALEEKFRVRALVRNPSQKKLFASEVDIVVGDLTQPETLSAALIDIDAIVMTHGTYGTQADAEAVDYGAVRNILINIQHTQPRIALMTTIGTTDRRGMHDWKRRGEWLVRASGLPYTIVRPAWFDYNAPDEKKILMLQGDKKLIGSPKDGVISRRQIAEVLVRSLTSPSALRKTLELHASKGPAQENFEPLFASLTADRQGSIHGINDIDNMPLEDQAPHIQSDVKKIQALNLYRPSSTA